MLSVIQVLKRGTQSKRNTLDYLIESYCVSCSSEFSSDIEDRIARHHAAGKLRCPLCFHWCIAAKRSSDRIHRRRMMHSNETCHRLSSFIWASSFLFWRMGVSLNWLFVAIPNGIRWSGFLRASFVTPHYNPNDQASAGIEKTGLDIFILWLLIEKKTRNLFEKKHWLYMVSQQWILWKRTLWHD